MPTRHALDPELSANLSLVPVFDGVGIASARQRLDDAMAALPAPATDDVRMDERTVPGPDGAVDVPIRVYRPSRPAGPAAVLDVHGGGFFMGSAAQNHAANVSLARRLGVVVVSVDYRLAPEHPFPAALHDCSAALNWLVRSAGTLGVDPARIALHGFSAGAGLCAGLALLARDRGTPRIAFQYLGCPVLDDRMTTPSMNAFSDTPMWTRRMAELSWGAYLGTRPESPVSAYAAPARADDLSGLPPAYVSVMTFDPLRDEGIAYAQRLLAADVPVELHLFPGTFHGSNLLSRAQVSRREMRERIDVLRRGLDLVPVQPLASPIN